MVEIPERWIPTIEKYVKKGEEYRLFSYPYKYKDTEYYDVYYFDRKKGAQHVLGFLIIDSEGKETNRELSVAINEAFNRYNLMFKKFQNEWGDVVQQDMRKFVGAEKHLENGCMYYQTHQQDNESTALTVFQECHQVAQEMIRYQDYFLQLDLEAIELGQKKRNQHYIDTEIDQEVQRIMQEFEQTIFDQFAVQYNSKEVRDSFVHFFEEHEPPKELKKSIKKSKRAFKKMDKNILKNEERFKVRVTDPKNNEHYQVVYQNWAKLLRNT